MASVNKVFIMGHLGQDPELRYTQNQTAVVTLNVATTEAWSKDGQRQEQTEWHRIIVWNKQAENCAKYLSKGRAVFVEGRLQTRSWEDKNGQKRYTTEINAANVQFMPSNNNTGTSPSYAPNQNQSMANQEPFPPASHQGQSAQATETKPHDNLDDIPF